MRRTPVLAAALLALLALAAPAWAHRPARVKVAAPADGARVSGDRVRVVLVGEGGTAAATFRLDLDGAGVDATGRVGGVFSTVAVRPGQQLVLTVPVSPGAHVLTMTPDADTDSTSPAVVRRFVVLGGGRSGGSAAGPLALAAAAVLAALAGLVALRRRAARRARAGSS